MKRYLLPFKNKYILTLTVFLIYNLFLDDVDIFSIISQNKKLSKLQESSAILDNELKETKQTLSQLHHTYAIEIYARERKYFKRDNEDVFVIVEDTIR